MSVCTQVAELSSSERVLIAIRRSGAHQYQIAKKAGLDPAYLSRFINYNRQTCCPHPLSSVERRRLAKVLHCNEEALFAA